MSLLIWLSVVVVAGIFGFVLFRGAPYVPTHRKQLVRAFTELYRLDESDLLVDIGSGDGVVLLEAARRGARVVGYEINPLLLLVSRVRLRGYLHARVQGKDYLRLEKLPEGTTVVYAFTSGHSIEAIERKLEQWSGGTDFVFISYGFELKNHLAERSVGAMKLYRFVDNKA